MKLTKDIVNMKVIVNGDKYTFKDIDKNSTVTINGKDWRDIVKEQDKPSKYNLKNIWSFFQGNFRYQIYYSKFAFLLPKYIREQIQVRINSMDRQCYQEGQCKMCGCQTTALQMANKACDKPCYPSMMSKKNWKLIQKFSHCSEGIWWNLMTVDNKKVFMKVGSYLVDSWDNGDLLPELVRPQNEWVDENETVLQSIDLENHSDGTNPFNFKKAIENG